ncbi:MAG TPA: hypothetical protein VF595_00435 [Tepidisphaeraceae bacterium]|jgi:DNA-3-methyladenine glycosylase II
MKKVVGKSRPMWFDVEPNDRWADAIAHLRQDKVMRGVIARVGPCTLRPRRDTFVKLVQSILSQQVSVAAAASMYRKLAGQFTGERVTPADMVRFLSEGDEAVIRSCGLSRQKRAYVLDLAERFHAGQVPSRRFSRMTDEQIIETLTPIKGIGRWTVEMLLIFGLNRTDVWPIDDMGLQEGVRREWGWPTRPKAKEIIDFGDKFRPYRSIATWYLWRSKDVPALSSLPVSRARGP